MTFTNIKNLENPGIQRICVDSSGIEKETIYVCDAERNVLKFNKKSLLSDEKPVVIEIPDATSASIAWHGKNICFGYRKVDFIMGSEHQLVGLAKNENFDDGEISGPLEFQMDVITVDLNDEHIVGGSSDYAVKCISLRNTNAEIKTKKFESGILCVRLDPKNEYVCVSTVDGNVTIIDLISFDIVETLKNAFPRFETVDVSRPLIQMSWSTDGNVLFVPSGKCVKSYRRESWEESGKYCLKEESENFSVTSVSLCGKYMAASTMDNQIAVWDSNELSLLSCHQYKRNAPGTTIVTSIEFSPFSSNQLIIADSNKGICALNISGESVDIDSDKLDEDVVARDSDDEDSIILNRTGVKKDNLFDDEAMDDDEDTRMSTDIGAIKRQFNYDNQDIGGLEEFGFKLGEPDARQNLQTDLPGTSNSQIPQAYLEPPVAKKMLVPERFVCNSSPVDPEATQRFLKYNRFGIVRSYINEANKVSTIDIEFHDKSNHGDVHIDNFEMNYELADIAMKVVALASMENRKKEKELDKENDEVEDLNTDEPMKQKKGTSILHVIPIQAFDSQRWSMTLPRGDGCLDVLCSNTQVVVLTKKRNIRVFTIGGIQRQVFTHFAPILTATCLDDRIAIASVSGSEFYEQKKTPQWRFEVVEYSLNQKSWYGKSGSSTGAITRFDVPVETGEQLDWIAYSSQGKLAVMDSAYNVHVLSAPGFWVPVFQGTTVLRALSDGIFPVGLTAKEFRYIYCRGSRSPVANGINAPITVEWKVPFCQPESHRTGMEHGLFINELALADAILDHNGDRNEETKELTKKLVTLFAWLTKSNSDGLAAEIASLVASGPTASAKTIQSLCTYASKCKKLALSEKVAEIGRQMTDGDDDRSRYEEEIRPTKRIALAARKVKKAASPIEEDHRSDDDDDRDQEEVSSRYNPSLDVSMSSQPVQPLERLAKNPFAKSSDKPSAADSTSSSQASLSIFDQLETTSMDQRKRVREPEPSMTANPTARKQAKLKFGVSDAPTEEKKKKAQQQKKMNIEHGKENETDLTNDVEEPVKKSVSPYEMWLLETKSSLKFEFDGEEAEFSKFCIQTFRALSKDQKDEWKAKAHAAAQN